MRIDNKQGKKTTGHSGHVDNNPLASETERQAPVGSALEDALRSLPAPQAPVVASTANPPASLARGPMDLIHADHYPQCRSLHDVVRTLDLRALPTLAHALTARLGSLAPPGLEPALVKAGAHPDRLAQVITAALTHTPDEMRVAFDAAHAMGKMNPTITFHPVLEGKTRVAWSDFATLAAQVDVPPQVPTRLADLLAKRGITIPGAENIVFGEVPNTDVSDGTKRKNILLSDMLNRVGAGKLTVTLPGGGEARSVEELLTGLSAAGVPVAATASSRVADFISMKLLEPQTDGTTTVIDVPMAVLVRLEAGTRKKPRHSDNPAIHSELVFTVGEMTTRGFHGIGGTGFFPSGISRPSTWTGGQPIARFNAAQAAKAAQIMSLYARLGLGYGDGVCNDSVMMPLQMLDEQAMAAGRLSSSITVYPLLLPDDKIDAAVLRLLGDATLSASDRALLEEMRQAIKLIPADAKSRGTPVASVRDAAQRATFSVWGDAPVPLQAAADALKLNPQL